MSQEMQEAMLAEIAAQSVAIIKALSALSVLSGDRDLFLKQLREFGLDDLSRTMVHGIPTDRYPGFLEKAKAKYVDIVSAIKPRV